jgi:pimeloyl-ACP methyl ester carboxylesterase
MTGRRDRSRRASEGKLYPEIEPYENGSLAVGDGNLMYWETCGDPNGRVALVLHGGPGSGCTTWHRRLFDPAAYRIVLFDQRGCGRSMPHASEPDIDLATNTSLHLVDDIERLRRHLEVDRWLVMGGSWGSLLALTYAERHPDRVDEMILLRNVGVLEETPATIVQGRFDFQSPLGAAWALHRAWPRAELVVVEDAGHDPHARGIAQELVRATDRSAGSAGWPGRGS